MASAKLEKRSQRYTVLVQEDVLSGFTHAKLLKTCTENTATAVTDVGMRMSGFAWHTKGIQGNPALLPLRAPLSPAF